MKRWRIHAGFLALAMGVAVWAAGQEPTKALNDPPPPSSVTTNSRTETESRTEGEKRFRANCGRCHQTPHKFPTRMMATIVRHMRVRATLTDEDMKLILKYMTD
jgi:mono/diheme cytochrome c family protein